jgi:deoxyguanosine kinase
MNGQNQVILSIGSNLGNRLENIQLAVNGIHKKIGTVIKISKLYESKSWGFDSEPFYNCAILIHTNKNAKEILLQIFSLENKSGRVKSELKNYQDRSIDIDIICIENQIVKELNITVPHQFMQDRKFVLQPMLDLKINWKHPVLLQNISELFENCKDKNECTIVGDLQHPLANLKLENYNYIAIEGNIGAGKTTLTNRISDDFNAKTILERFADNPFLPKFYEDQNRYAFPLEMSFLADRYQQLADDLAQFDLFKDFIVADYHIFKSLIFAKVTLADDEFRLYKNLFDIIYKEMKKPDLYIYLYQNTNRLLENIKKRGRSYEQNIEEDYLEKINQGYLDYIKSQTDLNVLIIDVSDKNFVTNQADYAFVLKEIENKIK